MKYILFILILFAGFTHICHAQSETAQANMLRMADSLYQVKNYRYAARWYNAAFELENADKALFDLYTMAVVNTLVGNDAKAINYLSLLVTSNPHSDYDSLLIDANFRNLHPHKNWPDLVYLIKTRKEDIYIYARVIKSELLEMQATANRQKRSLDSLILLCGRRSIDADRQRQFITLTDSINFLKIKSIIYVYGYMGADLIGNEANQVMFGIILNRDYEATKKYVPIVWQAYLKHNASAANYAAIADKVSLQESRAQIYGSIVQLKKGTYQPAPILNAPKVDSLRQTIGLPPLKEYLKQYGVN